MFKVRMDDKADKQEILQVMSMPGGLRFEQNGSWRHDRGIVEHPKIAEYFSRHLSYDKHLQSFVVAVDGRCVLVEVEDAPFLLRTLDLSANPALGLFNDGVRGPLDFESLMVAKNNRLYIVRCDNGLTAMFSRSAQQEISRFFEMDETGAIRLIFRGVHYAINKR